MENQTIYDIEQRVYEIVMQYFDRTKVHLGYRPFTPNYSVFQFDIVVVIDSEQLMAIEVKRALPAENEIKYRLQKLRRPLNLSYLIYTNGEEAIQIAFGNKNQLNFTKKTFTDVLSAISNNIDENNKRITLVAIKKKISNAITNAASLRNDSQPFKNKQKILNAFVQKLNASDFEQRGGVVSFKNEAETSFFQHLLDTYQKEYIERFSSSRNLFLMLEKGTINMCSLICMNDPSEQNYADDYTGCKDASWDANSTFILSACPEDTEDELTMWRLYADDAKGVCVRFKVDYSKIGKNGFYLAPINYASEDEFHFELEVMKHLFTKEGDDTFVFSFSNWNIWKHFFKKKEFSIENEIRLVYIPDLTTQSRDNIFDEQVWFMDDKTSIYSEMKLFKLDGTNPHFPLTVDKIYLGIKFPARDENVKQFQQCLETRKVFMTSQQKDIFTLVDSNYR